VFAALVEEGLGFVEEDRVEDGFVGISRLAYGTMREDNRVGAWSTAGLESGFPRCLPCAPARSAGSRAYVADTAVTRCWSEALSAAFTRLRPGIRVPQRPLSVPRQNGT
jgi:hypothetical protein